MRAAARTAILLRYPTIPTLMVLVERSSVLSRFLQTSRRLRPDILLNFEAYEVTGCTCFGPLLFSR